MNFQELRERADNLSIGHDILRDLRRALNDLDSAIDSVKDAYNDFDSAIDELNVIDDVEAFLNDIVAMEDDAGIHPDASFDKSEVWEFSRRIKLASMLELDILSAENPKLFWIASAMLQVNEPASKLVTLVGWINRMFDVEVEK
jgi:hypothetical protein